MKLGDGEKFAEREEAKRARRIARLAESTGRAPEDRRIARQRERETLLDTLVPKRVCPDCGRKRLDQRMWSISMFSEHTYSVRCRPCEVLARRAARLRAHAGADASARNTSLESIVTTRVEYLIRGRQLARLREARGELAFKLALRFGISRVKLCRIESAALTAVDDALAARIADWIRESY